MEKRTVNNSPKTAIVIKSSIWYTISNFLTRSLVFITMPLFSRILSTEEFGNFHVFANWQNMLLVIGGLEIYATVNRARFDFEDDQSLKSYITTCLVVSTAMTMVILTVYLLFRVPIERFLMMDRRYIIVLFAYLFTRPAFEMFQAEQRVHYKYKLSAGLSFTLVISASLLALFLAFAMTSDRLFGRIIGQFIPYIVLGIIFYIYYIIQNHNVSLKKARYAIKLAIPLVFSYLGSQVLLSSDKIIVQHLSSAEAVAYLGIATSCAHIMLIFVQSLNNAWQPWYYDKLAVGDYRAIQKTFAGYIWFVIFCTSGALLFGPELVRILGGKKYLPSVQLLPPNMLGGAFTLLVSQYTAFETFHKKQRYAAIITGIVALINVALDIVGVKIFGYLAASYVTVLCYILLIAIHVLVTRPLGVLKVFPLKMLVIEILAVFALIPVSLLLYRSNVVRYTVLGIFIVLFIVIMWIKRDMIQGFIKGLRK